MTVTATTLQTTVATPAEPAAVLAEALARYAMGYEFTGTALVNGEVATVVAGRWMDNVSQMMISSGDGDVEYVVTRDGQWARLPGGDWEELDGTPVADNPLAALASPERLELMMATGDDVRLRAVFPAATLGLTGDPVEVQLVFDDGALIQASYRFEVNGNVAESVSTFTTLANSTPITTPPT